MEKEVYHFPPISGRADLPAGIYLNTMSLDEIEKRKRLGYKLVIPVARYISVDYLSLGAEGFFLSRLMEYVSELSDTILHNPLWMSEGNEEFISLYLKNIMNFDFEVVLLREKSTLSFSSEFMVLTIEDLFQNFIGENYSKYQMLFYLALIPEFTHIEKIKGIKDKKIDFSIYNKALRVLDKFISHLVTVLK